MIEAKDLKLGNLFTAINSNEILEVLSITKQPAKDGSLSLVNSLMQEHCFPIPLTEDWLKRAGFRAELNASKTTTLYINDIISLAKRENGEYSCAIHTILTYPLPVKVKYVHDLQNLFYALTKTDLTFTK